MKTLQKLLFEPATDYKKWLIILLVAVLFVWRPQNYPIDWTLNTEGFWSDFPNTYKGTSYVYPPWALIMLIPYRLLQPEGVRIASVLVIGWLVVQQKWSLSKFFAIVFSTYFLWSMSKSSGDILLLVLPIILWRACDETRFQSIGWGVALSLLAVKPQGAILIYPYLLWTNRHRIKALISPVCFTLLVIVPISLVGSPPMILQWINNITHPIPEYQYYWTINNVSLTASFSIFGALAILASVTLILIALVKAKRLVWTANHTLASLLSLSMFLSPYASQQSMPAALAFVPSWGSFLAQTILIPLALELEIFRNHISLWGLSFTILSLVISRLPQIMPAMKSEQSSSSDI